MTSAFPEAGTGLLAEDLRDAWPFLDGQERIEGFRLLEASEAEDLFESLEIGRASCRERVYVLV